MKKIKNLTFIMIISVLVGLFSGCGDVTESKGDKNQNGNLSINGGKPVTLTVNFDCYVPSIDQEISPENPFVFSSTQKIINEFTSMYPNVTVVVDRSSPISGKNLVESLTQWITPRIAAGTAPDLAVNLAGPVFFGSKGWFMDMKEEMEKPNQYVSGNEKWRDLYPDYFFTDRMVESLKGEYLGVPYMMAAGPKSCYFYNKEIFTKLNLTPPKTWEEFMKMAELINSKGYIAIAAQPGNRILTPVVWDMQFSIGPAINNMLFDSLDYSKDGSVDSAERLRMILEGYMNPLKHSYVMDGYEQVKRKYDMFPKGYQNTDFDPLWDQGQVAMLEDSMFRLPTELSNTNRKFEFGMFPPPMLSNDTYDYLPAAEYTEKGPDKPDLYNVWSILTPSVEAHGAGTKEAAVEFLKLMSTPDNITAVVLEMRGANLGAVKGSVVPPELTEWLQMSFPKHKNSVEWAPVRTPENTLDLDKAFEQWMLGSMNKNDFMKIYRNLSVRDAYALIESGEIDTSGWSITEKQE